MVGGLRWMGRRATAVRSQLRFCLGIECGRKRRAGRHDGLHHFRLAAEGAAYLSDVERSRDLRAGELGRCEADHLRRAGQGEGAGRSSGNQSASGGERRPALHGARGLVEDALDAPHQLRTVFPGAPDEAEAAAD